MLSLSQRFEITKLCLSQRNIYLPKYENSLFKQPFWFCLTVPIGVMQLPVPDMILLVNLGQMNSGHLDPPYALNLATSGLKWISTLPLQQFGVNQFLYNFFGKQWLVLVISQLTTTYFFCKSFSIWQPSSTYFFRILCTVLYLIHSLYSFWKY